MPVINKENIKDLIFPITISIVLLTILTLFTHKIFPDQELFYGKWMHFGYIEASENLFSYYNAPYCWRLMQPVLVNLSPIDQTYSFFIISLTSIFLTSLVIYKILRKLSFDKEYSTYGLILYLSLVWGVRFNIMEFWYADALLYFWVVLAIYFIYSGNNPGFIIAMVLGVFTKENMLLVVPLFYTIKNSGSIFRNFNRKLLYQTILFSLPAVCLFIFLKELVCSECDFNILSQLNELTTHRLETIIGLKSTLNYDVIEKQPQFLTAGINIYRMTMGVFGGLIILLFITFKENKDYIFTYLLFIVLAYVQIFIATDIERLLIIIFFPLVLLSVNSLYTLFDNKYVSKNAIRVFVIVYFSIQIIFSKNIYQITYYSSFAQTFLCFIFLIYTLYGYNKVKN